MNLTASEAQLQDTVIQLAILRGWQVAHFRPARTDKGWRTPVEGHRGFPDLALARGGRFIGAELKRQHEHPTPEQRAWLLALGGFGRVWRPSDMDSIMEELR